MLALELGVVLRQQNLSPAFEKYRKKNLAALILQARKSGSLIHCITNIMQFKSMESFVLCRHNWVFVLAKVNYMERLEKMKFEIYTSLDTTFLHVFHSF